MLHEPAVELGADHASKRKSRLGLILFFVYGVIYAAGGTIHWSVNGIAFAGDYISAASFPGICGMIAYAGY